MPLDPFSAVEKSLGINRPATTIAIGGFVVMALAIGISQMLDDDRLTFWQLLAGLAVLIVAMMALTVLPLLARRLIAWVLTLCFAFIAITATGQAVTQNGCPRLATATCILSFHLADGCAVSRPGASGAAGGGNTSLFLPGAAFAGTLPAERLFLAQDGSTPTEDLVVYIQFAGFKRGTVVDLARQLAELGWEVAGGDRGGERISAAIGLNEVRYFHPDDREAAMALALAAAEAAGEGSLAVVDLSAGSWARTDPGLLEVWISE